MDSSIKVRSTNLQNIKVGDLRAKFSAAGDRVLRYYVDFRHTVLDLHKEVNAPEISILQNKVDTLMATWDKKFEAHQKKTALTAGKELAEKMAIEAEDRRNQLRNILNHTLQVDDTVDWEVLKDHSKFQREAFPESRLEEPPKLPSPHPPKIGFFQILFGQRKKIENEYRKSQESYKTRARKIEELFKKKTEEWNVRKTEWEAEQARQEREFKEKQDAVNAQVDELRAKWLEGSNQAILEHANIVLDASEYDDLISKEFELQYMEEDKTLLIDYALPSPDDLPATRSVRFVASTGELKETEISASEKKTLL
jgi:restriction system protein